MLNLFKRHERQYPIKKDEYGKSARKRCFEAFDSGKRPAEVCQVVDISLKTACTYFYQWKKLPEHLEDKYQSLKRALKEYPQLKERIMKTLSEQLDIPENEVKLQIESPWGIKQLVSGKWNRLINNKDEMEKQRRTEATMKIVELFENEGAPFDRIVDTLWNLYAEEKAGCVDRQQ